MHRYVTRAADIGGVLDAEVYLGRTVFEPDPEPQDTGLLDACGLKIWRVTAIDPIGFVRFNRATKTS